MTEQVKELISSIINISTGVHILDTIYNPISDPVRITTTIYFQDNVPDYTNGKIYQSRQTNVGASHDTAIVCIDNISDAVELTPVVTDSVLKLCSSKIAAYWVLPDGGVKKFPDFDTILTTLGQTKVEYICSNMDDEIEGIVQMSDGGVVIVVQGLEGSPPLSKSFMGDDYFFPPTDTLRGIELVGDSILVVTNLHINLIHEGTAHA